MGQKNKRNKGIKLIRKSNDLIEARYKFDIWETRIFSTVLTQISPEDEDFKVFRITPRDMIKEFEIHNGNAYDLLREAAHSLMDKRFFINYEVKGAVREQRFHIIRSMDYLKEVTDERQREENEYIELAIEPEMKQLLLELKNRFTSYDMRNIIRFRSSYTVRIYEHLKQYESIGRRVLDIEYLKRIFELATEYPLFANFYQKIIEPALRDINLYADIEITNISKIKSGRKVESLLFEFRSKPNAYEILNKRRKLQEPQTVLALPFPAQPPLEDAKIKESSYADKLFLQFQQVVVGEFGVSPTAFLTQIMGHTEGEIERAIRVTRRTIAEKNVKNTAGFFIEALRNNYIDREEQQVEQIKIAQKKKDTEAEKRAKQVAERLQLEADLVEFRQHYTQSLNDRIRELTLINPSVTEQTISGLRESPFVKPLIEERELQLNRVLVVEDFRQDKILRELVKGKIIDGHKEFFAEIAQQHEPKIRQMEFQIRQLK
ncbi:MAG: replication initiation protein [Saprospiraceae bacterium]|nr:replication initiation protein [Saprospiraceae bacterium]